MRWFVIGRDGQKYGPADLATLQRWVGEKRITPDMMLEEEHTGRRLRADTLPGLQFTDPPATAITSPTPAPGPTPSPHPTDPVRGAPGTGFGGAAGVPGPTPAQSAPGEPSAKYWVIGPDGRKYGPADLAKLQQWASEGRIGPNTMLEDFLSGQFIRASALPGLVLGPAQTANPWAQAPGSPYPRQPSGYYAPSTAASNDLTWAWVLSVLGFLCCVPLCFVGLYYADRAKKAGVPGAQAAFIVALVLSILGLLFWIVNIVAFGMAPAALENL